MRRIENIQTTILYEVGKPETLDYCDLIERVIASGSESQRYPISLQRKDNRVLDVIEKVRKEKLDCIELEDADFDHFLFRYGEDFSWNFRNPELILFDDYVKKVKADQVS